VTYTRLHSFKQALTLPCFFVLSPSKPPLLFAEHQMASGLTQNPAAGLLWRRALFKKGMGANIMFWW